MQVSRFACFAASLGSLLHASDVELRHSILAKACPCCRDPKKWFKAGQPLSLLLARVSSNVLAATNIRVGIPAALQRTDIDIDISLAAVGNYELHLGLWLSVYRHSVGSLKSMCLDELAMSGAIKYCLCRWHFACGLMSSKQGYH